ncbi:MAG: helix-turn-helix transcriptional regulator [Elusimicrobiota bacterium]|jgi:transcriptional regulator with XRE-family HTH domain
MTDSIKLLDKYCETCKHPSDSAAARALKVQPSAVNNWRQGRAKPSAEAVEKMCTAIGEPLRKWLPLIEAERARTPADRKVWLRLAQAAAIIALTFSRPDVYTSISQSVAFAAHNPGTMYIMSKAGSSKSVAFLVSPPS